MVNWRTGEAGGAGGGIPVADYCGLSTGELLDDVELVHVGHVGRGEHHLRQCCSASRAASASTAALPTIETVEERDSDPQALSTAPSQGEPAGPRWRAGFRDF